MARKSAEMRLAAEQKRRRIITFAIILFLLGLILVFVGTYAYYQRTITGTVIGTVSTWSFKANNSATSFNVTLVPNGNATSNSTMAPGTSGSFSVVLSAAASELPVDYVITFSNFSNIPTNLVFYTDAAHTSQVDLQAVGYTLSDTLLSEASATETWYWEWPYGTTESVAVDNADANKVVSFTITVVGTQKNQ
ncbi:MAG: hypothetical protein IJB71_03500 [Bacilli bacterium]|nr:hypothetical protein [Bacilli bacterium]